MQDDNDNDDDDEDVDTEGQERVCLMKPGGTVAAEDWSLLPTTNPT